ncbi:MAG: ATP-binding protein [Gemmatimonadaceae bacterium]
MALPDTGISPPTPSGGVAERVPVAQRLLLDILDTVRQPLLVLDAKFRVTQANRAFFRTFRVNPTDTIGTVLFALGDGQWDIAPLREMLREKLPLESQLEDFDVDHVFPGIGRKVMLLNARLVSHDPDEPRGILLSIEDVTEIRENERRLAVQRRELERSNVALDEYASIASHDLQEPLRKILSFGEQLVNTTGPALDATQSQQLDRMMAAAARMRTLIDDLLLYSQFTTRVTQFAPIDLGRVAREVIADLDTAIADADAKVEVGSLPVLDADALEMRQLLQNLIGNALKYRRPGRQPVVILSATNGRGPVCSITVSDNGIGFKQQYANKIFKMFERLHGRGEYAGSGIGLALCRRIVERHGGSISATSAPDDGATFRVDLPVSHDRQQTQGHSA